MKSRFKALFAFIIVFSLVTAMLPASAEIVKEYEYISLFEAGGGDGPKNTVVGELAQKFTVPAGSQLEEVIVVGCPTWSQTDSSIDMKLYKWNTDYSTTVAGTVLGTHHETNHVDNTNMVCKFGKTFAAGDYLIVFDKASATNSIGAWTSNINPGTGSQAFVEGVELANCSANIIINVFRNIDTNTLPLESTVRFDFSKSDDVARVTNCMGIAVSQENNVLKLTHEQSTDPGVHIKFAASVNAEVYKYCAFKVKKSAGTAAACDIFYNVLDASADGTMVVNCPYQDTTDWQLVIMDLSSIKVKSLGYFRLDTFGASNAGDIVEIESIRFFKTLAAAEASLDHPNPMTNDNTMIIPALMITFIVAAVVLKKKSIKV